MRRRPQPLLVILLVLTAATAALGLWRLWVYRQQVAEQSKPAMTGASEAVAPDFTLETVEGGSMTLADLRGQVVLLNFWATWCPPCKAEMPSLEALYRAHGQPRGFVVLGVNVEEPVETVAPFVREQRLSFPILLDRDGTVTSKLFHVRPLPTTLIIDREGRVQDVWNGEIAQEAMLARLALVW